MKTSILGLCVMSAQQISSGELPTQVQRETVLVSTEGKGEVLLHEETLVVPGARAVRICLDGASLGKDAVIAMSDPNGAWQCISAQDLVSWNGWSAVFNSDCVLLQVFGDRNDPETAVGRPHAVGVTHNEAHRICGSDDRELTSDNRVGRMWLFDSSGQNLGVCTAWRSAWEHALSAGHCISGGLAASGIVEFNVPLSRPDGTPVFSHPSNQYPINMSSLEYQDLGTGADWCVFRLHANSMTGLTPYRAYGAGYRLSRQFPQRGAMLRITGFGKDMGSSAFACQSAVGDYKDANFDGASDIDLEYFVDTAGGNSGSPIVWEARGVAVGIHTTGRCLIDWFLDEGNAGTSFEVDALESALRRSFGSSAIFVDGQQDAGSISDGSVFAPHRSLEDAISSAPANAMLVVLGGTYKASEGNAVVLRNPMAVISVSGQAIIGN